MLKIKKIAKEDKEAVRVEGQFADYECMHDCTFGGEVSRFWTWWN